MALVTILAVSILCYDKVTYAILLSPYILFYFRRRKSALKQKRMFELNNSFADAIGYISAALEAGYSVENAVREACHDLSLTYGEDDMIIKEMSLIVSKVKNNVPIEEAFYSFASRSELEDIKSFADVFSTAKRTGGNVIAIIRSTTGVIRERTDLRRELRTVIASKKYESDIMKAVPFAILLYLRLFSPDMVSSLYGNLKGNIFMTLLLIVYLGLSYAGDKIVDIEL